MIKHQKATLNHLEMAAALGKISQGVPVMIKQKKLDRTYRPRGPYKRAEDELRKVLIDYLIHHSCLVYYIENRGIQGVSGWHRNKHQRAGVPDLWVFSPKTGWAGWVEVKTPVGVVSPEQWEFAKACGECGVKHMFVRRVEDLLSIVDRGWRCTMGSLDDSLE